MRRAAVPTVVVLAAAACGPSTSASSPAATVTVTTTVTVTPTPSAPSTFEVTGSLVLSGGTDGITKTAETCSGSGGYSDIGIGTQVVVYDEASKILASGELGEGQQTAAGTTCTFDFAVEDVPGGPAIYQVEVAHRGKLTEAAADIQQPLALTLGS